jgi:hypothetical protein
VPIFEGRTAIDLARGFRAFVEVRAGLTRAEQPPAEKPPAQKPARAAGVRPESIVWIFGAGRTGSTWLARMMAEGEGREIWFEPQLGNLFDPERLEIGVRTGQDFVFAPRYRKAWLRNVRTFVLDGANARFPSPPGLLLIKEPHGSAGAPLLVEALPESGVVLLVRDPRDVVASALDAAQKGMWQGEVWRGMYDVGEAREDPDAFVAHAAGSYLRHVGGAKSAYEAHRGRKALVRYEDLRENPVPTLGSLYAELKLPIDEEEISNAVEKHAWENVPQAERGEGKFYRKARPGGWREDLSPEQAAAVERITAPLLEEFYPG